jgi:hypothetical protein
MALLWDILAGILGAIVLLVLLSFLLTTLTNFYQELFDKHLPDQIRRGALLLVLARSAAVATIALFLALLLTVHLGGIR